MSPAKRYHVRVFHISHQKAAWDTELDLGDQTRLRETFIAAVDEANPTRAVRDYAEWSLEVYKLEQRRGDHKGPRLATVTVDGAGRTVVTR